MDQPIERVSPSRPEPTVKDDELSPAQVSKQFDHVRKHQDEATAGLERAPVPTEAVQAEGESAAEAVIDEPTIHPVDESALTPETASDRLSGSAATADPDHRVRPPAHASSTRWDHLTERDQREGGVKEVKDDRWLQWGGRLAVVAATLALMLFIPAFIMRVYTIPSESMETTLHGCDGCDNDRVLVDRMVYRFRDPRPGEVVVFTSGPGVWSHAEQHDPEEPNPLVRNLESLGVNFGIPPASGPDFVKRVIAVGGQTVSCCDSHNRIVVDGEPVDEPYVYFSPEGGPAVQAPFPEVEVPAGMMWMMGDNRNASLDSRAEGNGPVPVSALAGKVRMIIYPVSRLGAIKGANPPRSH